MLSYFICKNEFKGCMYHWDSFIFLVHSHNLISNEILECYSIVSGSVVKVVQAPSGDEESAARQALKSPKSVRITGIDYYGFLQGRDVLTGENVSIHPDGNSFNMMEGLVYTKTS